jgi:hypothetical protein
MEVRENTPAIGGKFGDRKIAINIKTARKTKKGNKIRGFTIGSFAGYFLYPKKKR